MLEPSERDDSSSSTTRVIAQFSMVDPSIGENPLAKLLDQPGFDLDAAFRLIIDLEYNPNTVNSKGDSLLHIITRDRLTKIFPSHFYSPNNAPAFVKKLQQLKAKNANFDLPNREGKTPLQYILDSTYPQCAFFFIELGANADTKNSQGQALIHILINELIQNDYGNNWQTLTETLIKTHRANVNLRNGAELTPFQLLLNANYRVEECFHLLRLGANPNVLSSAGETFLIKLLKDNRMTTIYNHSTRQQDYCYSYDVYIKRAIQDHRMDIEGRDSNGRSAFQWLLEQSTDPEFFNNQTKTAAFTHNALLLLSLGAAIRTTNSKGQSFFTILEANNSNNRFQKTIDELLTKFDAQQLGGMFGRKKAIVAPLEAYYTKWSLSAIFTHNHNDRAKALVDSIMKLDNLADIQGLLRSQLDFFQQSNRAASASSLSPAPSSFSSVPAAAATSASSSPIDARFNQASSLPEVLKKYNDVNKESGYLKALKDAFQIVSRMMAEDHPVLAPEGQESNASFGTL